MHRLVELPSYVALPQLLESSTAVDFAYVDGWHTFDYVLVDFFYIDKLLAAGGVVGFNDCGYRAIQRALSYVRTHRKYEAMDVGLRARFEGRNLCYSLARRVLRQSREDRYFRKVACWEPAWNVYSSF